METSVTVLDESNTLTLTRPTDLGNKVSKNLWEMFSEDPDGFKEAVNDLKALANFWGKHV